jgi:triacylglycerol lipase
MLVHGLGSDGSCFQVLEHKLRSLGHPTLCVDYSGREADLPGCGRELERQASRLLRWTRGTQVQVVAHSLGGLVVRWAATHTQLQDRLGLAITLGTPHGGTPMAFLAPRSLPGFGEAVRLLRPGLPDLPGLVDGSAGGIRWVTIAGRLDWVVPPAYALLPESAHVTNVVVPRTGHLQLTRRALCHRLIAHELEATRIKGLPRLSA